MIIFVAIIMARTKNFDETAVLDKAVDIFRRQGFKGTSPEELVTHLGISRSSLYNAYGDKRGLFIKSLVRYQELTTKALNDIADGAVDAFQGIRDIFDMTVHNLFEDKMPKGCFLVNSIVEFGADDTETVDIVKKSMDTNRETMFGLVKRGQENGQLNNKLSADTLADYLVNCLSGISVSAKAGIDKAACKVIVEHSLNILK
jgi:TetR/AcrR family transcriptional repressor of nem operon